MSTTNVKPIPDGYHTATPYLIIKGAAAALDYYQKSFAATEIMRMPGPDGQIGHAEIQIGNSRIMLADECPQMDARSPKTIGGTPVGIMLYVEDVDTVFNRAVANGGKAQRPVEDKFYGDRMGTLEDPFGHQWHIATHKEDLTPEEIGKRMAAMCGGEKKAT
jgi:PhnB protein